MPILALPGLRQTLAEIAAPVLAITPIVSGVPIESPGEARRARSRAALMAAHDLPHRAEAVACLYRDLVDAFVLDEADYQEAAQIEALGMTVMLAPTLFQNTTTATATIEHLLQMYPYPKRRNRGNISGVILPDFKEGKWSSCKN